MTGDEFRAKLAERNQTTASFTQLLIQWGHPGREPSIRRKVRFWKQRGTPPEVDVVFRLLDELAGR